MKNQNPFKYGSSQRYIDRRINISNLIVRLDNKHHVTAGEIKVTLGNALWNDFRKEELASCPEKLTPVITSQLAIYSKALDRADRLDARWKHMQNRAFIIYCGKKFPVMVAKNLCRREACKQYEMALELLRGQLEKNHILYHYFDLPVLGEVLDDIAHEYESMPRFRDTLAQINREILSRFRKSYLTSLYKELYGRDYEPTEKVHFPPLQKSDSTRHYDHLLDESWAFDQHEPGPLTGFFPQN